MTGMHGVFCAAGRFVLAIVLMLSVVPSVALAEGRPAQSTNQEGLSTRSLDRASNGPTGNIVDAPENEETFLSGMGSEPSASSSEGGMSGLSSVASDGDGASEGDEAGDGSG
ncbi:hypothetical protein, partial [Parvibacter caecicola]|uniref:hypothetical protein n=1 Tax=Parvibacter caecicola TaxID=747645 RepID=UPI002730AEC8